MGRLTVVQIAVAVVAAAIVAATAAQPPDESAPKRRAWTGTIDDREVGLNFHDTAPIRRPVSYVHDMHVEFTYTSESVPGQPGVERWLSRRITWSAIGSGASAITGTDCQSSGSIELGPSDSADAITPEQREQLKLRCQSWSNTTHFTFITTPPDSVPLPRIRTDMANCETRRWSVHGVDYTQSVSGDITASVDPPKDYAAYVPAPGSQLTFTARSASGPVRFRFELDANETSRFPGYATNATIDDVFFDRYELGDLRGSYTNDGPDFIFDRTSFKEAEWSRRDQMIVETAAPASTTYVTVTAMDYGAVGRLRGYVKAEGCGTWQPISVQSGGSSQDFIEMPVDQDDNLMADALEEYRQMRPEADDDAEPKGNGMHGDGLTAFEEYRGLLTRGVGCGEESTESIYGLQLGNASQLPGLSDEYERTSPRSKDLFVHTPDPELALIVPQFANATGLKGHLICEPHYVNNDVRIVNHTLQRARLRQWRGYRISQEEPQHGIRLEPVANLGRPGIALPVSEGFMGPPKFTLTVQVTKPAPGASSRILRGGLEYPELVHAVVHELGHAVGIPHHSDDVENFRHVFGRLNITTRLSLQQHGGGPPDFTLPDFFDRHPDPGVWIIDGPVRLGSLVVEPGRDCDAKDSNVHYYKEDKFVGCWTDGIARRGQQNSGDFECPMRYSDGAWYYEAPGSVAQFRGTAAVIRRWPDPALGGGQPPTLVDVWGGTLLKYRRDIDRDGVGPMCKRIAGTVINSLPGEQNHNGDAGRQRSCAEFIVVNDVAARGIQ